MIMVELILKIVCFSILFLGYYIVIKKKCYQWSENMSRQSFKKIPGSLDDRTSVLKLILLAITHGLFCYFLWLLLMVTDDSWYFSPSNATHLIDGVGLGAGLLGASMGCCQLGIRLIQYFKPDTLLDDPTVCQTVSKGGWVKHHWLAAGVLSGWVLLALELLQIGSEEMIFRGLLIQCFLPYGVGFSLILSVIFFTTMQAFLMTHWFNAFFPCISAVIMGSVHGILFIKTHEIWPLIVSHLSFFLLAMV